MTEFACGLIGLLLGAGTYALGLFAARERERIQHPAADPDKEAERERLRQIEAEQRAFRALMGYNADVAYGLGRPEEELR